MVEESRSKNGITVYDSPRQLLVVSAACFDRVAISSNFCPSSRMSAHFNSNIAHLLRIRRTRIAALFTKSYGHE